MIKDTVNKFLFLIILALLTSCAVRLDSHFSPQLISKLEQEKINYKNCHDYSKSLTDVLEKARTLDKQYNFPRDLSKANEALSLLDSRKINLNDHYRIQKQVVGEFKNINSIRAYYTYYQDLPVCGLYNESIFLETVATDVNEKNYSKDFVRKSQKKVAIYLMERFKKPSNILFLGHILPVLQEIAEQKFLKIDSLMINRISNDFFREEQKNSSYSRALYKSDSLENFEKFKAKMIRETELIKTYSSKLNKVMEELARN